MRAGAWHCRGPAAQPAPGRQIPRGRRRSPGRHCGRPGRRDGGRRLWVDPAAMGAGRHERRTAARRREGPPGGQRTTRSGERGGPKAGVPEHPRQPAAALARRRAHPPRDRGRRQRDRRDHHADGRRPGHGRHAAVRGNRHHARRHHRPAARPAGRHGRAAHRAGAAPGGERRPGGHAAAGRRHHLRAQDRQGREPDRLEPERRGDRPARARLRPLPRRQHPARG